MCQCDFDVAAIKKCLKGIASAEFFSFEYFVHQERIVLWRGHNQPKDQGDQLT